MNIDAQLDVTNTVILALKNLVLYLGKNLRDHQMAGGSFEEVSEISSLLTDISMQLVKAIELRNQLQNSLVED
jgi:hypothetical protein